MKSGMLYIMCAHLLLPGYLYAMEENSPRNSPQSRIRRLDATHVLPRQNETSSPTMGKHRRVPTLNMAAIENVYSAREHESPREPLTPRPPERAQTPRSREGTSLLTSRTSAELLDPHALALFAKFKEIEKRREAAQKNVELLEQRLICVKKIKEYIKNADGNVRSVGLELTEKEKRSVKAEKYAIKYFILKYTKKQTRIREELENKHKFFIV